MSVGESNQMKRRLWQPVIAALLAALLLWNGKISVGAGDGPGEREPFVIQQTEKENLLVNGSMEEGFYWKYPNHYVANGWRRWWVGDDIPEYDDVRAWRPERYDGNHAQVYFRWGRPYTAGIYQQVVVRPCTLYQFSVYGRNHSGEYVNHHARVGIDPLGRKYRVYMSSLPPDFAWSPEQTFFYTWGMHTVITESRSYTITAITYVSPGLLYMTYDTFWDAATLVELPPSPGRLPDPSDWSPNGFIANVAHYMESDQLVIEWETMEPASAQVWYQVHAPAPPTTSTGTLLLSAVYLPLVINSGTPGSPTYAMYTPIDESHLTHHQAVIHSLEKGQVVEFVIVSRHLVGDTCRTSPSATFEVAVSPKPPPPSPILDSASAVTGGNRH